MRLPKKVWLDSPMCGRFSYRHDGIGNAWLCLWLFRVVIIWDFYD
jgi:hypothetical protein